MQRIRIFYVGPVMFVVTCYRSNVLGLHFVTIWTHSDRINVTLFQQLSHLFPLILFLGVVHQLWCFIILKYS